VEVVTHIRCVEKEGRPLNQEIVPERTLGK
jgi:hypothetical protein